MDTLSNAEIRDAALTGWVHVPGRLRTVLRTDDFAAGLALAQRIGAAAEAANHHPDLHLTYPTLRVDLTSHDAGGVTTRDVELARTITGLAAEAGVALDPGAVTVVELGLDTAPEAGLTPFYVALLGGREQYGEPVDPSDQAPGVWFQEATAEPSTLPAPPVPQRWHLDVWVAAEHVEARLAAVLAAGGSLVSDAEAPAFWVVEDADGNRSCLCTAEGRWRPEE